MILEAIVGLNAAAYSLKLMLLEDLGKPDPLGPPHQRNDHNIFAALPTPLDVMYGLYTIARDGYIRHYGEWDNRYYQGPKEKELRNQTNI